MENSRQAPTLSPSGLLAQQHILKPFRFRLVSSSNAEGSPSESPLDRSRKWIGWAFHATGLCFVLLCWIYFLYYLRFVFAYGRVGQPGKPASLVGLVTDLPEYLVQVRGPLLLSLMFYKAPQISGVVSRSLDLSLHYSCCAKLLRRRGSVYAVLLSLLVVTIEQAPSMYIWISVLFSTPSFSSKFNPNVTQGLGEAQPPSSRDPIKLSAGWKFALHWIIHAGSHFLIDQITLLLVGCSLVVSSVLSRFNGQVNKLRLPSNEPVGTICMERHAQFVGELVVSYEEVRQLWRNVNKEFMLLFAAVFGLDVTIMLGYVVSTVSMIVTGEGYSLISLWRETSQAIFAAVRLLLVSVPLVLVHEKVHPRRENMGQ
ncbi:hypothetical protein RvY_16915 [Ramazzottius varieornatus]|uniref:Uncharacterized protein n=1 Tax=Ramazzottius varieornatus TaxID=947166 RepID=A0A1D1W6F7_RAMVA|nr:hypothetical protein RvY_16915 [Ramazzottius varieornatus]